jgi:hypothetical protein
MTGASRRGQAFLGLIDPEVAGQAKEDVERTAGPSPALAGFPVERVGFGEHPAPFLRKGAFSLVVSRWSPVLRRR